MSLTTSRLYDIIYVSGKEKPKNQKPSYTAHRNPKGRARKVLHMAKKVNVKDLAKAEVASVVREALVARFGEDAVSTDARYGLKAHSVIVKNVAVNGELIDIRVDLTNPKAGHNTYDYVLEKADAEALETVEA